MQAIILVCDHPDIRKMIVPVTDPIERAVHVLLSKEQEKEVTRDCNCIRNNSIDRVKILLKYLRRQLKLEDNQITFLRTSVFDTSEEIRNALEYFFEINDKEDILFYYSGHGIAGKNSGWSLGKGKYLYYRQFAGILEKFSGRLCIINDCCYSLSLDKFLKPLGSNYMLFGPSRKWCISSYTVLDSVLRFWSRQERAVPVVAARGLLGDSVMDIPANVMHPSYYSCGCGTEFKLRKTFTYRTAPSLRRGAEIDHLFFPA